VRASLFVTCLNDTLFPGAARATVELLERLGVEVEFREEQTCCGQMHLNSGYREEAARLARRFAEVFDGAEAIVTPSASCAAAVRHHYADLDPAAAAVAPRVHELSEFIVDRLGVTDVGGRFPHRVAFHPTCHSTRMLGVGDRPQQLLRAVKGIELLEIPKDEECCGFGGTFAVKNADTSTAMLSDKQRAVLDTGAEVLTAADTSCLMHIGGGLARSRTGVRTLHFAEILAATG
jgi:L-lactate dehydrogenase complex protein LldE